MRRKIFDALKKPLNRVAAAAATTTFLGAAMEKELSDVKDQIKKSTEGESTIKDKVPVYPLSYSLPISVDNDLNVSNRPGGLGLGVNPVFNVEDSDFHRQAWLGVSKHKTVAGKIWDWFSSKKDVTVDEEMQILVNQSLQAFGNMEYVFLPSKLTEEFYKESANGVFWPLHHDLIQYVTDEDKSHIYEHMNELMAEKMVHKIKAENNGKIPDDTLVWVHDYHFQSAPKYLKEKAPNLKIGYVHHIPYPKPQKIKKLIAEKPEHKKIIVDSIIGILNADSISFHAKEYKKNFIESVKSLGIITDLKELQKLEAKIIVNPIGISKKEVTRNLMGGLNANIPNPLKGVPFTDETLGTTRDFEEGKIPDIDLHELWTAEVSKNAAAKHKKASETKPPKSNPLKFVPLADESLGTLPDFDKDWDSQTKGELTISPEKINIGAVSRLDYTKGILELVNVYHEFLKQKVAEGVPHPEKLYQLNIVASAPRDIAAYIEYQKNVTEKMDAILEEFPGSLTFIPGVDFKDLPLNNAAQDIIVALSPKDGYLMAAPEALKARLDALKIEGLIPEHNKPTAIIISEGAGVVESLKVDENGEINIPKELSVVDPSSPIQLLEVFNFQTSRIFKERSIAKKDLEKIEGVKKLVERINTVEESGVAALKALHKSTRNDLKLNDPPYGNEATVSKDSSEIEPAAEPADIEEIEAELEHLQSSSDSNRLSPKNTIDKFVSFSNANNDRRAVQQSSKVTTRNSLKKQPKKGKSI